MHPLHDGTDAFKPHACINRRLGQRLHCAIFLAVKLHKDTVPNLNIAVAIFVRRTGQTTPNMLTMVIKNLCARAARACVPHHPKVIGLVRPAFIIANGNDTLLGQTDVFVPNIKGFIIGVINSHIKTVFWQGKPFFIG